MNYLHKIHLLKILLTTCLMIVHSEAQTRADDSFLTKLDEHMGTKGTPSEAFIVKQDGDIQYMADMEIVFFDDSIKKAFEILTKERSVAMSGVKDSAIASNPELKKNIQNFSERRAKLRERENSIKDEAREMKSSLILELNETLVRLSELMEDGGVVMEEYREITRRYDNLIIETRSELDELNVNQRIYEIEKKALSIVNNHIVHEELTVNKLQSSRNILETDTHDDSYAPTSGLVFKTSPSGWSFKTYKKYHYFERIPRECHGIVSLLVPLLEESETIKEKLKRLNLLLDKTLKQRSESLIPWVNKHDVDLNLFQENYQQILIEFSETETKLSKLKIDNNVTDSFIEEMEILIKKEIKEEREWIQKTEQELIEVAILSMEEGLEQMFYSKFYSMIKAHAKLSIRTGSRGNFIIPPRMEYLLASHYKNNGDANHWFLKVESKFGNFHLSNSNAKSVQDFFKSKSWMFEDFSLN